jgi:hypothetical protein
MNAPSLRTSHWWSLATLTTIGIMAGLPAAGVAQPMGTEFQANTSTAADQHAAAVASDSTGSFVVVWQSDQDGDPDVFGQRYDSQGNPVGPEFKVNAYTSGPQRSPAVASDASGAFVVVWESIQPQDRDGGIFGRRYDPAGDAIGAEFRVNAYRRGLQASAAIAVQGSGDFVVVWHGERGGISGQRFDAGGRRLGDEFRVNTTAVHSQIDPAVAADGSGNFVVVWHCEGCNFDDDWKKILAQRYDSMGRRLGQEIVVDNPPPWNRLVSENPDVATDANGNFVVVWQGRDGWYYNGIYGRRYDSGGQALGGWFAVDVTDYGEPCCMGDPSVAADEAGDFIVVWHHPFREPGGGDGVFARSFDASGQGGSPFQVNTYTPGVQTPASGGAVSSDPLGDFVVVWQSDGQDGDGYGVFGERSAPFRGHADDSEEVSSPPSR